MDFENSQFDDEPLDVALKQYSAAEPRAGLESRILANLASERDGLNGRRWHWQWIAATLGIGMAAVVGLFLAQKPDSPRIHTVNESAITNIHNGAMPPAISDRTVLPAPRPTVHRGSQGHDAWARTEPRLDQFPSPAPLNEQEELLARYVRERRQEAVMVARARAKLLKQELAGFLEDPPSSGQPRDLQQ
jgi:hypothetical protein